MSAILLTGGGCPGWFSTWSALSAWASEECHYFVACDMLEQTPGSVCSVQYEQVPAGSHESYPDVIRQIVDKYHVKLIVPLTDPELVPLAHLSPELTTVGCRTLVSDPQNLTVALDKGALYNALPDIAPQFAYCPTASSVHHFIQDVSDGESCFVKLRTAHGSRGTKKLVPYKQWMDSFGTHKPEAFGFTFPLNFASELLDRYELIAIETLPGAEYSIDCLFSAGGNLQFYGARERETTRNGICSVARFKVDEDGEFLSFIETIAKKVRLKYNINIQAKRDKDGQLKLLEINPRISGSLTSFLPAGYNLALAGVKMLLDPSYSLPVKTPEAYVCPRTFRVSHFV